MLDADVTIAGDVVAHLFASTTGSDADWIVKLIDVYPDQIPANLPMAGYEFMVSNEVFRGRYRQGFERAQPITPGVVQEYTFSLHTQNYAFLKGHRIMVQVQSTWFPLIDRNPQTFVKNIFIAKTSDFRSATHRIFRSIDGGVERHAARDRAVGCATKLKSDSRRCAGVCTFQPEMYLAVFLPLKVARCCRDADVCRRPLSQN